MPYMRVEGSPKFSPNFNRAIIILQAFSNTFVLLIHSSTCITKELLCHNQIQYILQA